jgi:hypothetical protein
VHDGGVPRDCFFSTVFSAVGTDTVEGGPPARVCVSIIENDILSASMFSQDATGKRMGSQQFLSWTCMMMLFS